MIALAGVLASLFVVVAVGSTVPVLPTGAAVSGTAVVVAHSDPAMVLAVVAIGAGGAYLGDALTYLICRAGGEKLTRRLGLLRGPVRLADGMRGPLLTRPLSVLLVSRLVPGGRIPVLLTAAVLGLSWRRFAVANVAACALWSTTYAGIGLLGGSLFPEPWQGVLAAIVVVVAFSQVGAWLRRRRDEAAQVKTVT
jgi:membrane protein DedA with SNARE-associated domain